MAVCPRCGERPSKRPCPALSQDICARCCAESRLKEISCPEDCGYLENEEYQRARRDDRARSSGREFIAAMAELFSEEDLFDLAIWLQGQVYGYLLIEGERLAGRDDSTFAEAYEAAARAYSPLVLPEPGHHPLAAFVLEILREPNPGRPKADAEIWRKVLRVLARYARSSSDREGRSYEQALESYYSAYRVKRPGLSQKGADRGIWRPGWGRIIRP